MSRRSTVLSRRTMLRGIGASLAIPWLEAMTPEGACASTAKAPVRMGVMFMPNGVHPDTWTPQGEGRDFRLSPTLAPLRAHTDDILVLTNLWNEAANTGDGHYVKAAGFLTCRTINKTVGVDLNSNGVSVDQFAVKQANPNTPIRSLELGTEPVRTGVDSNVGYTRVYGGHIAWRTPTSPLAKEINPRLVYERLFRAHRNDADTATQDKPLLDLVLSDAHKLRRTLGHEDQQRMDEYLHSVRTLEERIERSQQTGKDAWQPRADIDPDLVVPDGIPENHAEHVQMMLDLMILALQTDTTRVCTFMFGNSVSNKNFTFLDGVDGTHHSISHHQNDDDKLRMYQIINRWHSEQFAYVLRKMKSIQEGNATLLDNSMMLFGSALRDGDRHDPRNLPIVLAGRAGGRIDTGKHLSYQPHTPLANLYVSMLDAFGCPVDRFADSTEPLRGVLA